MNTMLLPRRIGAPPHAAPPPDLVRLYHAVRARRVPARGDAARRGAVLQMVAATPGEGTSTLAAGLAEIAASVRGESVLLVDCAGRPGSAPTLTDAFAAGADILTLARRAGDGPMRIALAGTPYPLLHLGPSACLLFDALRDAVTLTVLDCAPALRAPESAALAAHCDGTVLVVRAGHSAAPVIQAARAAIELSGGQVIGAVLNRRRAPVPHFIYRLL